MVLIVYPPKKSSQPRAAEGRAMPSHAEAPGASRCLACLSHSPDARPASRCWPPPASIGWRRALGWTWRLSKNMDGLYKCVGMEHPNIKWLFWDIFGVALFEDIPIYPRLDGVYTENHPSRPWVVWQAQQKRPSQQPNIWGSFDAGAQNFGDGLCFCFPYYDASIWYTVHHLCAYEGYCLINCIQGCVIDSS